MSLLVALDDVRFVAKFKIAYFFSPSFLHEWNVLHVLCVIWKTVFHLEKNVRFCFFENWTLSVEIALGFDHCGILLQNLRVRRQDVCVISLEVANYLEFCQIIHTYCEKIRERKRMTLFGDLPLH